MFLIFIIIVIIAYNIQDRVIFRKKNIHRNYLFPEYIEEHYVTSSTDHMLHNILVKKGTKVDTVILIFHGIKSCVVESIPLAKMMMEKCDADVFIHDYRNFGKNKGRILNDKHIFEDCDEVYSYVKNLNYSKIYIYGKSMGTCPAVYLASKYHPDKLLLETPYFSMKKVILDHISFLNHCKWFIKYELPTHEYITFVMCKTYFFHGALDELIHISHCEALYKKCNAEKVFYIYPRGNHGNLLLYNEFRQDVQNSLIE